MTAILSEHCLWAEMLSKIWRRRFNSKKRLGVPRREAGQTFEKGPVDVFQKFRSHATSIAWRHSAFRPNMLVFPTFFPGRYSKIRDQ
jgi:hypothetical protein